MTITHGTRCECDDRKCHDEKLGDHAGFSGRCHRDAVRMVKVRIPEADSLTWGYAPARIEEAYMCEPCATFEEGKRDCSICRGYHGLEIIHPCE